MKEANEMTMFSHLATFFSDGKSKFDIPISLACVTKIQFSRLLTPAQDFIETKVENMMKAWAACDYKHTDLRRDFLAAPVAQRGLSYEDPESVQSKWLNMLEAKR